MPTSRGRLALLAAPLLFVAVFFLWPVAAIIARGLASGGVGLWEGFTGAGASAWSGSRCGRPPRRRCSRWSWGCRWRG
ncbi:hypothetical protein [Tsukamurella sp. PLM1]|uniref:hypothetical protein n=1 Tax=Tsukamurella sp. PLM1 TaxID=2929795 RepID=UPI0020BD925F|nr:hypothetical protein [Tsukamurella sp. PLM1]